jgi:heterodisulfide reductase subunit C
MVVSDVTASPFVAEVLSTEGGRLVLQCYQCGTCSGSCPVVDEMEHGPRRLVYMIQAGLEEEVLTSRDMWRCVSCYSCAHRCPRGIEITALMADLRRLAVEKGYAGYGVRVVDREAEFGRAFMRTVGSHGRLYEPELLARYYARVLDVVSLLKMTPLGLRMLLKGKLPFLPERVTDPSGVAALGGGVVGFPFSVIDRWRRRAVSPTGDGAQESVNREVSVEQPESANERMSE